MDHDVERVNAKAGLRAMMVARRCSISAPSRIKMDLAITSSLALLPEVLSAHHIHLYLSISALAEVNTAPVIDVLAAKQTQLSVPVVQNGDLFSALYHKGDVLRAAQFGQPEPEVYFAVDESDIDLVLLPLLAFDGRGYRLGYGKGFYDRFLQRLGNRGVKPFRIGLSYLQQRLDELPVDLWDEPLDAVVHENGCIRFT